jgi:tripartite-type tricarboxylate transporter receptor subunit TctC
VAYARARPGKVDFGSGGNGITAHLAMELLQSSAGIKLNHVPYKGTPAALNDVMGGQIPLMMDSGASALQYVRAGKLKALGTTMSKRSAAAPGVPTLAEQGLAGFDVSAWNGMVVPASTPQPVVDRLNASIRRAAADPQVLEMLRNVSADPATDSPAEFGAFMQSEIRKWAVAVAQAGVQID